jgi:hypothetical protein
LTLSVEEIIAALDLHRVRYVVIGGLGAVLHGSPIVTQDADICPARARDNLDLLAAALRDLGARLRVAGVPGGVPFPYDGAFLSNVHLLTLTTPFGVLDLNYDPAGTDGYEDLVRNAVTYEVAGKPVRVASLDDIIRSKEAANREKDRAVLPTLRLHSRMLREATSRPDDEPKR